MKATLFLLTFLAAAAACGSGDQSCGLEPGTWSVASSGGLCQANFFGETDYGVYCAETADGQYDCACGPVSEDPLEFVSPDFCDLEGEARACEAIARCGFPL